MASVATVNHIVMAMLLCTGPEMIGEMWSCRPYHYRIITRRAWATWFVDSIRTTSTKHVCKPGMFNSLRVQVISIPKKIPFIAFLLLLSLWYLPSASHMAKPRRLIHLYIFFLFGHRRQRRNIFCSAFPLSIHFLCHTFLRLLLHIFVTWNELLLCTVQSFSVHCKRVIKYV